ncbi:MAG: hypothetical protein D6813_00165 [Calditrichaeota bacterium]|nr:MAG: hypothetical protein D6813_00165 [Calditrichota bacterium]
MVKWRHLLLCIMIFFQQLQAQQNPHKNLSMGCEKCHVTTSWTEIHFDHDQTNFQLAGKHARLNCQSCHNIQDFSKIDASCTSCHEDIHQGKMSSDCDRCHQFRGWEILDTEEIHKDTRFPLLGRHVLVDCWSCHKNQAQGDFALGTTECVSCHQQDYLAVENPNHVSNAFSTSCQECHNMDNWRPAFLPDHDSFFPIFSGSHSGVWNDCKTCHQEPANFSQFTCFSCHEHNQAKMDDKHRGIPGYVFESSACLDCHPSGSESELGKDHDSRFFPIYSGTHSGAWQGCSDCHVDSQNRQVVSCIDCHEHNPAKTDAQHSGISGYVYATQNCLNCHPTGEKGEFREHDNLYFPIFSGKHRNKWDNDCSICHIDPNNRKVFSCFNCHEHNQSKMDDKHREVRDYVYESQACYECHPTGREEDD